MKRKDFSWIIALCGLWEAGDIAPPFVPGFGHIPAFVWNHIGVGILLMIAGVWAALTHQSGTARALHWLTVGAGGWLLIASFTLTNPAISLGVWNDIIIGAMVIILGLWAARSAPREAG